MEDQGIIALFFDRSEQAIEETDKKYGGYCYSIAYNILSNREDSEESVSDTYLAAWNTIPPRRPNFLNAFLAKMTRHISIDRWRKLSAKKRGGGEIILALDELEECVDSHNVETELAKKELTRVLNMFLSSLTEFLRADHIRILYASKANQQIHCFHTYPSSLSFFRSFPRSRWSMEVTLL